MGPQAPDFSGSEVQVGEWSVFPSIARGDRAPKALHPKLNLPPARRFDPDDGLSGRVPFQEMVLVKREAAGAMYLRSDGFVQPRLSSSVAVVSLVSLTLSNSAAAGSLHREDRAIHGAVVAVALNEDLLVGTA
jgi:hypothetical protein